MRDNNIGRPMEILFIEDSLTFARITMSALRKESVKHRMSWVTNGQDAVDFLFRRERFAQAPRPDLILLDLGLPIKDGRDVLTELRADDRLKAIPVVVLTASVDEKDATRCEALEVEGYMTKPVDLDKFLGLVRELKGYWHADMIVPSNC